MKDKPNIISVIVNQNKNIKTNKQIKKLSKKMYRYITLRRETNIISRLIIDIFRILSNKNQYGIFSGLGQGKGFKINGDVFLYIGDNPITKKIHGKILKDIKDVSNKTLYENRTIKVNLKLTKKERCALFGNIKVNKTYLWYNGLTFVVGNKCVSRRTADLLEPGANNDYVFSYIFSKHGGAFFTVIDKAITKEIKKKKYLKKTFLELNKKYNSYLVLIKM